MPRVGTFSFGDLATGDLRGVRIVVERRRLQGKTQHDESYMHERQAKGGYRVGPENVGRTQNAKVGKTRAVDAFYLHVRNDLQREVSFDRFAQRQDRIESVQSRTDVGDRFVFLSKLLQQNGRLFDHEYIQPESLGPVVRGQRKHAHTTLEEQLREARETFLQDDGFPRASFVERKKT